MCRDVSQFKLANAIINTTDELEKSGEVQTPHSVPDLKIQETEAATSVSPDKTANAEQKQGAEQDQPVTASDQTSIDKTQTGKASAFTLQGLCVNLKRTSDS